MFPSVKTRFTSAARRGFDLAIEVATLGEYELAPAARPPGAAPSPSALPAARGARPPGAARSPPAPPAEGAVPTRRRPSRVKPATPAARRLQPVQRERR